MSTTRSAGDRLAAFTHELSQANELAEPRVVRRELAAVFEHGLPDDASAVPAADLPASSRRRRVLTTLSGVLATVTGKVVLGTAIAAASVGAAHSTGVVDVPGLPDMAPAVESPDVELPDQANNDHPESDVQSGTTGSPESPGVDGTEVSDRATSGEPQEDGKAFGTSIADEATEGTPAEGKVGGSSSGKPDTTPGGNDTADEHTPDDTPSPPAPADQP
jgi:hypothetical protein